MTRKYQLIAASMLALLMMPTLGFAVPYISEMFPWKTSANTGNSLTITGTGFGSMDDRIYFPSNDGSYVTPYALVSGGVQVVVPETWSGDVYLQANGTGSTSNYVAHRISFSYAGYKWPSDEFTWYLHEDGAPGCTFTSTYVALDRGNNAWTCASGAIANYGGTTTVASTSRDNVNTRYWSDTGWEGDQNVLAYATTWYSYDNIVESDIAFNAQYFSWTTTDEAGSFDVGQVGTHEEGHSIGLLDLYGVYDNDKTMYGHTSANADYARTLASDDAYGAEFMYPHWRPNLTEVVPSGWSDSIVPRNVNNSSHSSCILPTALGGNTTTYLNVAAVNDGYDCLAPTGSVDIYVDGVLSLSPYWNGIWNPVVQLSFRNNPYSIVGGRHTIMAVLDPEELALEENEYDNAYQDQFVWSPLDLVHQATVLRDAPPDRGTLAHVNCDGFEFSTGGTWWAVVGAMMENGSDDYDMRLHNEVPLATSGFGHYVASSIMDGNEVEYVLVNGNVAGGADITRWAGLNRWSGGNDGAHVELCQNVGTLNAPVESDMYYLFTNHFVMMHEIYLDEIGNWQFILDNVGGNADLGFALYDKNGNYFGRQGSVAQSNTNGEGQDETFFFDALEPGYYGVVVFKDSRGDLPIASAYHLRVRHTPANLTYQFETGWDYPVVARNDDGASAGNVHVSPVLDGNTNTSYFSVSGINDGPNAADSAPTRFYVDENYITYINWMATIDPQETFHFYDLGPITVRGGRHTAEWRIDEFDAVIELNEDDNTYMRQYVWSPLPLVDQTPLERAAPPVRGSGAFYNCDGFAQTSPDQFAWIAVACPLSATDDYDLAVYDDYSGSESGFSDFFLGSGQGPGQPDYIAGSYSTSGITRYPAVNFHSGGVSNYVIDNANSLAHLEHNVPAQWNGESLGANRLVDIFEVNLAAGETYLLEMANTVGSVNLDVFAHKPSDLSLARYNSEFWWMAQGAGGDEGGQFIPSESGYYVFVVVKNGSADVPLTAAYNFAITQPASGVAEDDSVLPTAFALVGNHPNPFNPLTEISFEIPAPGSSVRLEVFDLNGHRIRTLMDQVLPAGRFSQQWNGRNDQGEVQASGTYFYQLKAGSFVQTRKMILLK